MPGKSPSGVAALDEHRTDFTPGKRFAVSTSCARRAERLSARVPWANLSPRSTVATPRVTVTLRSGTPPGSCVRMPSFFSAALGPASSPWSASSRSAPSRPTRHRLLALEEVDVDGRARRGRCRDARREQPDDQNEPRDPGAREAMTHHEPGILPATGVPRTGKRLRFPA